MKKTPYDMEKYNKNEWAFGGDILKQWNYNFSGGSVLNDIKKEYSVSPIPTPLSAELESIKSEIEDSNKTIYGYFSFQNLLV